MESEKSNYIKTFGLDIKSTEDFNVNLPIYIESAISEYETPIKYFIDCVNRDSGSLNDIIFKNFERHFINEYQNEKKIIAIFLEPYLKELTKEFLNFLEKLIMYIRRINKDNLKIISIIRSYVKKLSYKSRINYLIKLLQSSYLRDNLFSDLLSDGIQNEKNGFFSFLVNKYEENTYEITRSTHDFSNFGSIITNLRDNNNTDSNAGISIVNPFSQFSNINEQNNMVFDASPFTSLASSLFLIPQNSTALYASDDPIASNTSNNSTSILSESTSVVPSTTSSSSALSTTATTGQSASSDSSILPPTNNSSSSGSTSTNSYQADSLFSAFFNLGRRRDSVAASTSGTTSSIISTESTNQSTTASTGSTNQLTESTNQLPESTSQFTESTESTSQSTTSTASTNPVIDYTSALLDNYYDYFEDQYEDTFQSFLDPAYSFGSFNPLFPQQNNNYEETIDNKMIDTKNDVKEEKDNKEKTGENKTKKVELKKPVKYKNFKLIKKIIDLYMEDEKSLTKLIILIHDIFELNKAYKFDDVTQIKTNKCSSINFLILLFEILLYIRNTKLSNTNISNINLEKEFKKGDIIGMSIQTLTTYTILLGCEIAYNNVFKFYYKLNKMSNKKSNSKVKKEFDILKSIRNDKNLHNDIYKFYFDVIKNKVILSSDMMTNLNWFLIDSLGHDDYKNDILNLDISFLEFFIDCIGGCTKITKPNRWEFINTLIKLFEIQGYTFISKHNNLINKFFNAIQKFIIEVDYFAIIGIDPAYSTFQYLMGIINNFCKKITNPDEDIKKNMKNIFHIIAFRVNSTIAILKECIEYISSRNYLNNKSMIILYEGYIKTYMVTFMSGIQAMQELLMSKIISISDFPEELIMPLVTLSMDLLSLFSKGSHPIYGTFKMNMEALDIMQELFKLINISCENTHFVDHIKIKENYTLIKEMMLRVKLDPKIKNNLLEFTGNLQVSSITDDDLPNEYLDPILFCEIKNPVMLPDVVDVVFDRSSIMSHLYTQKTHPYTRQSFTEEELDEYNKKENVKNYINDFMKKIEDYKNSLKKE